MIPKEDENVEMLAALTNIRTAEDMVVAFRDEEQCRRLLESMVWPAGEFALPVLQALDRNRRRDMGKARARPGLYQCFQRAIVDSSSR